MGTSLEDGIAPYKAVLPFQFLTMQPQGLREDCRPGAYMFGHAAGKGAVATLNALGRSLAIIEFDPTGKILLANDNFCKTIGYEPSEIIGRHHSLFVDQAFVNSPDYRDLWRGLGAGEFRSAEFKRIAKGGRTVWLQACTCG